MTDPMVPLIRLLDERHESAKEAMRLALVQVERAADKVDLANKEYKVSANEWRDTVKDIVSRTPTREEFDRQVRVLEEKIGDLRESRSAGRGAMAVVGVLAGLAGAVLGHFLK